MSGDRTAGIGEGTERSTTTHELPILHESSIAVYHHVVRTGPISETELRAADLGGATPESIGAAIRNLLDINLIHRETGTDLLRARNPAWAAAIAYHTFDAQLLSDAAELDRRRAALNALSRSVLELGGDYFRIRAESLSDVVTVIESGHAVRAALDDYTSTCRFEVAACQPGGPRPHDVLAEARIRDESLLRRGIKLRSLYQHSARFDGPTIDYATAMTKAGAQIRTATTLPPRMIIIDGVTAFLPLHDHPTGAALVHDPSVASFLTAVFDGAWEDSFPFQTGTTASSVTLDATQQKLVLLLAEGLTVASIASRLGVAERTCQAYIKALFSRLGVNDRFQAGAMAQALGLVDIERVRDGLGAG